MDKEIRIKVNGEYEIVTHEITMEPKWVLDRAIILTHCKTTVDTFNLLATGLETADIEFFTTRVEGDFVIADPLNLFHGKNVVHGSIACSAPNVVLTDYFTTMDGKRHDQAIGVSEFTIRVR